VSRGHRASQFRLFACAVSLILCGASRADERSPRWTAQRDERNGYSFQTQRFEELELAPRGSYAAPTEMELEEHESFPVEQPPGLLDQGGGPPPQFNSPGGFGYELTAPSDEPWDWQLLPTGIIYKSYLASQKESRFATQFNHIPEWNDTFWEPTLGARVAIVRFGDREAVLPQGFQIDAEGSAQTRLNLTDNVDVTSVDFRGGVPLTYGYGPWRLKAGYYHLSSHLGDEFLLKNPGYPRLNFARDVLLLGAAYYLSDDFRIYGELGWAFFTDVSEPWELQFGFDYVPAAPTGARGAPFVAMNGHLREELNFSGNFTIQAGWAWRSAQSGSLFRIGGHYSNGASWQYSFYDQFEQQLGLGIWYDY
jgi:hypothetical protein